MTNETASLDENGLPTREGTYLAIFPGHQNLREIDVYRDRVRGLCCFRDDIDSDDRNPDCHIPIKYAPIKFVKRMGNVVDKIHGTSKTQNA